MGDSDIAHNPNLRKPTYALNIGGFFVFIMSITIEQQREKIRLSLEGKSVSIPSARTKKSYVKNGKKKFKARAYFKGIKNTYG